MQAPLVQKAVADTAPSSPDALAQALRSRTRDEWLEEMWAIDVPVQPCLPFGAVFDDPQARANEYIVDLDDPEVGTITVGGKPLTITPPQSVKGPAPVHGAHTDEVRREWTPGARAEVPGGRSTGTRWPLEGVKVLDLGNYLAGPYAPMLLAISVRM